MERAMQSSPYGEAFGRTPAEAYERHFVSAIGLPAAKDLVERINPQPGEKVLDVACGTGIVARLVAEKVSPGGTVTGVDVNAGMLDVARAKMPPEAAIQWYESPAESMPLPDETFDLVTCQLSLQFFANKPAALREMERVLVPGGRVAIGVPGKISEIFEVMAEGLAEHIEPSLRGFVHQVFSLNSPAELGKLVEEAGFVDVKSKSERKTLHLPQPEEFLWQYIYATPLAEPVLRASQDQRDALAKEVIPKWRRFAENGGMRYEQDIVVATARKQHGN